jgi:hypothetical protein
METIVNVYWDEPFNQGSPIIGYNIFISTFDINANFLELRDCDGSDTSITANH